MRIGIIAAAAALAALPALPGVPASKGEAANPVPTQPLAANEVLVELSATGEASSRADLATVTYSFVSRGATDEEARRAHDERVARLRTAAAAAAVAAADIDVAEPVSLGPMPDFSAAMAPLDMTEQTAADAAEPGEQPVIEEPQMQQAVQGTLTFRVRDIERVGALQRTLTEDGAAEGLVPDIVYSVADDSAARREARSRAIAIARADAEAYAAAMDMRVARIVRVTERSGTDLLTMMFSGSAWAQQMEQMGRTPGPDIPVRIVIGVDFALAPR